MKYRTATEADVSVLAELNRQLIQDEGHRNQMSLLELEQRLKPWLKSGEYEAALFMVENNVVAYALYSVKPAHVYLRQFFVSRNQRRKGLGKIAIDILKTKIWPLNSRIRVEVLIDNHIAHKFWKSVGFAEYAITLEM